MEHSAKWPGFLDYVQSGWRIKDSRRDARHNSFTGGAPVAVPSLVIACSTDVDVATLTLPSVGVKDWYLRIVLGAEIHLRGIEFSVKAGTEVFRFLVGLGCRELMAPANSH
ncbi:hypothetical protein [Streptomyces sp. NPDC047061]|uniref:hypothetical protein n=1 Tax=Streptomyces sp. NPDC047061 TaxID=3154605 RepID=UPI0033D1C449